MEVGIYDHPFMVGRCTTELIHEIRNNVRWGDFFLIFLPYDTWYTLDIFPGCCKGEAMLNDRTKYMHQAAQQDQKMGFHVPKSEL